VGGRLAGKSLLWRHGLAALVASAAVAALISTPAEARTTDSPSRLTDPAQIETLAADAYKWAVASEYVYRFENYNNLVTAPVNAWGGGQTAAAWNNNATNAGNASVLYLQALLDLSGKKHRGGTKELVLTVPPSASNYYVVNLLDAFINTVGSIGTRTTPSKSEQTYLLAGPTSKYAHRKTARIKGFTYRVLPFDTNLGWILTRIRADTLVPASDPRSAASILTNVVKRFAISTRADFEAAGHKPDYFQPGRYTPTQKQVGLAAQWQNTPTSAIAFFGQAGESLTQSPLPKKQTGLNGTALRALPSWIFPQADATRRYFNPSYRQAGTLARFKPLGLTGDGFRIPGNWGPDQVNALQAGYEDGQQQLQAYSTMLNATPETNFWSYLNDGVGTYPNTSDGYQNRATAVIQGGSANPPVDAVYPTINNLDGTNATQLDGNNTYKLTFLPAVTDPAALPVVGTLPPTVNGSDGNPLGLWSVHVYHLDSTQVAAPFISQATVQNTAYSSADIAVTAVDAATDTITVEPSAWGPLVASSPILFDSSAAQYGLTPGVPYYVANTPTAQSSPTTYSFKVSTTWKQPLSAAHVPIQGRNGAPGPIVDLINPGGSVVLKWGPIQPVTQLGSQQLSSGRLVKNDDGSVTIWIAPTLPAGAPETNWIPTPSSSYFGGIYPGVAVPTQIRLITRIYYPTPGSNTTASILSPPNGSARATWVTPALVKVP
jgi:hypothetical protein